ncbi:MAG: flippase [Myxococcota bacterium]
MSKSESPLRRLLIQASHYSLGSLLTTIAGLVSFPLLTRAFSVADYGVMNLVGATLTASVAIGKFGIQHSIIRYRSEIGAGKGNYSFAQLISTTLFGMLVTGFITMLVVMVGSHFAPIDWVAEPRVRLVMQIVSVLIIVQVVESVFLNFLRADQETAALMRYQVVKKYLSLGFMLFAVFVVRQSLTAFYIASLTAESIALAWLARIAFRQGVRPRPRLADFSPPLYRELLGFGIPMMIGYELSGIVLSVGDRYVVAEMIGQVPLGLYGAAYNLCQYVQGILVASVGQAIMPIYMKIWDEKGADETATFIGKSLRTYAMFGAPIIAGLAAVGPELLPSLASERYASASMVLPWVISGMVVEGANNMLGAGLFIHRKTRIIMTIVMSTAIQNIVLNVLLVPRFGIVGSAAATLVSYGTTATAMAFTGRSLLRVRIPWFTLLRAAIASVLMYLAVSRLFPGHNLITVAVRAAAGVAVYVVLMALIDPDARHLVKRAVSRFVR